MSANKKSKPCDSPTTPGGRKLVQARLPFKTLSGSPPVVAASSSPVVPPPSTPINRVPRKRKLSTPNQTVSPIRKINCISGGTVSITTKKPSGGGGGDDDDDVDDFVMLISDDEHEKKLEIDAKKNEELCKKSDDAIELTDDSADDKKRASPIEKVPPKKQRKNTPKSKKKRKLSDDENVQVDCEPVAEESSSFSIKLPMPKRRSMANNKKVTTANETVEVSEQNNEQIAVEESSKVDATINVNESIAVEESNKVDETIKDKDKEGDADDEAEDAANKVKSPARKAVNVASSMLKTPVSVAVAAAAVAGGDASPKALTPKQLLRRAETEKKLQEKQQAKEERERKAQEEKEARQLERDEKERQRKKERDDKEDQRRREKEEKDEQKRRERDERERKRQADIDAKNEERKRREDQKEEERRRRDEEKEAEEAKKRKTAEAFTKFFVANKATPKRAATELEGDESSDSVRQMNFMPFRIKGNMKLAPTVRRTLSEDRRKRLESIMTESRKPAVADKLYLKQLKVSVPEKSGKTWPTDDVNDIMIVDDELEGAADVIEESVATKQKYRAKFFKFEENRRPAFYGTWRKQSAIIKARNPFRTDTKFFDYEVDSDDEWEEEEPGESLHGSDDEKDKESDDDYDIDNEFFVPHGHLSDEEVLQGDDVDEDNSPDAQKAKLKIIQKEFADEMKKKTEKIKPRLIGIIWQNADGTQSAACPKVIWDMLSSRSMIFVAPISMKKPTLPSSSLATAAVEIDDESSAKRTGKFTDAIVSDLIRLMHGNVNNAVFLVKEFQAYLAAKHAEQNTDTATTAYKPFGGTRLRAKMRELAKWCACPEEGPMLGKFCWCVRADTAATYGLAELPPLPNAWSYILTKPRKVAKESADVVEGVVAASPAAAADGETKLAEPKTPAAFSIAKFTKVLSEEEKKLQFINATSDRQVMAVANAVAPVAQVVAHPPPPPSASASPVIKKRVNLLMSVPRGQTIPNAEKNMLISQFLRKTSAAVADGGVTSTTTTTSDENESVLVVSD